MTTRLHATLAALALCSASGLALAQYQTDTSDPTGQTQYKSPEPAEITPPASYREGTVTRDDVRAETRSAMRANLIPHGELSTPEQDKGAERGMTMVERGLAPDVRP